MVGGLLGLIGAGLAIRPLAQLVPTGAQHDEAMREGLGDDWEAAIPAASRARMIPSRLNIPATILRRLDVLPQIRVTHNIAYREVDGQTLQGDLYEPLPESLSGSALRPAILVIHGGGWENGSKGDFYDAHCRWLAQQGYVVFDVDYRLSPVVMWPGHLEDVKTALRWLRAQAEKYQIDPDQISVIGRSAGAHLALMLAFSAGSPAYPPDAGLPARDDVKAVVAIYAPIDIPYLQSIAERSFDYWIGAPITERVDLYRDASPLYVATEHAPPVLLAHGGYDNLVPPDHSERLTERLRELGVPCAYLYYPWARHGFDFSLSGLGGHMLQYDTDRFLAWALTSRV